MRRIGNFTAFFGADDVFSNWHPCQFNYHDVDFMCIEQFMMFAKPKLFNRKDPIDSRPDDAKDDWPEGGQLRFADLGSTARIDSVRGVPREVCAESRSSIN